MQLLNRYNDPAQELMGSNQHMCACVGRGALLGMTKINVKLNVLLLLFLHGLRYNKDCIFPFKHFQHVA